MELLNNKSNAQNNMTYLPIYKDVNSEVISEEARVENLSEEVQNLVSSDTLIRLFKNKTGDVIAMDSWGDLYYAYDQK